MVYPQMQHIASQKRSYWTFNIFLKTHIKKNKAKEKTDVKDHYVYKICFQMPVLTQGALIESRAGRICDDTSIMHSKYAFNS